MDVVQGMKVVNFVNWLTTVRMALKPQEIGSLTIKSNEINDYGALAIARGFSKPCGFCWWDFILRQFEHFFT